jgi:hypothetical protein
MPRIWASELDCRTNCSLNLNSIVAPSLGAFIYGESATLFPVLRNILAEPR